LNFNLEYYIFLCIIITLLSFFLYKTKKEKRKSNFKYESNSSANADLVFQENTFLRDQLTQLQKAFHSEQDLIKIQRAELILKEKKLTEINLDLEKRLMEETENRRKIVSQKKSSEVRLGNIAETLAPFLDQFEFDPENCIFLGRPIDYISFGEEEITLVEVKSGNSQLNSRQRQIRDQVKENKVSWKEVRIK